MVPNMNRKLPELGTGSIKMARKRMLAVYLGLGAEPKTAARKMGVSTRTVNDALMDPEFVAMVDAVARDHAQTMEILLKESEVRAIQTMQELLGSESDDVRLKAATDLLNRSGRRGMPVSKIHTQTFEVRGTIDDAVRAALSDPGVRAHFALAPSKELPVIRPEVVEDERSESSTDYELHDDAESGDDSVQSTSDLPGMVAEGPGMLGIDAEQLRGGNVVSGEGDGFLLAGSGDADCGPLGAP